MQYKPLNHHLVVTPDSEEAITSSGIELIEAKQKSLYTGIVVAVAENVVDVVVGDKIFYPVMAAEIVDEETHLVDGRDVYAIICE